MFYFKRNKHAETLKKWKLHKLHILEITYIFHIETRIKILLYMY